MSFTTSVGDEVVARCATVIDAPKAGEATSFVLHAPLELLARALLLALVPAEQQPEARQRMEWVADQYRDAGPAAATGGGELPPIDELVCSLAAAGHGPILLSLRPRVTVVPSTFGDAMVAAEIGLHPDWKLSWPSRRDASGRSTGDLEERLAAPPSPGRPENSFIFPMMSLTETSGLAEQVLSDPMRGMAVDEARRVLLRVAARSMLQDQSGAAPYGWTHCLTMPQAVLETVASGADPDVAVAVAATYVLGFRAVHGRVRLDPDRRPDPATPAGRTWSAAGGDGDAEVVAELAAFGALHPDAHVAKYTLACLDAAAADPDARPLFLAAAAHLHEWWRRK